MERDKDIFNLPVLLKGILSGGLLAGSFILQTAFIIKLLVFVFGFLVTLDSIFPSKEESDYPIVALIGLVAGFAAAAFFSAINLDIYIILIILITLIIYIVKLAKRLGLLE